LPNINKSATVSKFKKKSKQGLTNPIANYYKTVVGAVSTKRFIERLNSTKESKVTIPNSLSCLEFYPIDALSHCLFFKDPNLKAKQEHAMTCSAAWIVWETAKRKLMF